jgi:hypothetical protein
MLLSEDNLRLQHRLKELQDRMSGTEDLQLKVHYSAINDVLMFAEIMWIWCIGTPINA